MGLQWILLVTAQYLFYTILLSQPMKESHLFDKEHVIESSPTSERTPEGRVTGRTPPQEKTNRDLWILSLTQKCCHLSFKVKAQSVPKLLQEREAKM